MSLFTIKQSPKPQNLTLSPNGVGRNTALTPVGAANNWQCVDDPEKSPDEDTTHVALIDNIGIFEFYDLYTLPNHTTETGVINYVRVFSRAKSHLYPQSSSGVYRILIADNVDDAQSTDIDLLTSYTTYSKIWAKCPFTSANWTWGEIDDLQIGMVCSTPTVNAAPYSMTLNDDGIDTNEWDGAGSGGWYGSFWYTNPGTCGSCEGSAGTKRLYCTFEDSPIIDADGYTITKVTLVINITTDVGQTSYPCSPDADGCYMCSNETPRGKMMFETHAVKWSSDFNFYYNVGTYTAHSVSYTDNWGAAWTWVAVNSIIAGIWAYNFLDNDACLGAHILKKDIHLVVDYLGDVNPEIRTTQMYAIINYTPPDSCCSLTRPSEISYDHSRNVKMLNFWSGEREVYDLSRSNKTMVLTGMEYGSEACNRILCVRTMGKDGSVVTLSRLGFAEFNGKFRIRQFGWKKTSEKPLHFRWIMELEDSEL